MQQGHNTIYALIKHAQLTAGAESDAQAVAKGGGWWCGKAKGKHN